MRFNQGHIWQKCPIFHLLPLKFRSKDKRVRPIAVITGILLGSSVSITVSLAAVIVIFLVLGAEYPRLAYEFDALLESELIFLGLTAISSLSFFTLLKEHWSRWWLQGALWVSLAAVGAYFWP